MDNRTVNQWKKDRFERTYPKYSCRVLKGDGKVAKGNTLLGTVRKSYR
jgi:hypothetical protein